MKTHDYRTSRRTFLRGVGVAMALPWLESIPVWGASSANETTPGPFPKRFAGVFMGNGINPDHWWAKGAGAEMELGTDPKAPRVQELVHKIEHAGKVIVDRAGGFKKLTETLETFRRHPHLIPQPSQAELEKMKAKIPVLDKNARKLFDYLRRATAKA